MAMDYLSLIGNPIHDDLVRFEQLFSSSLSHGDGLLSQALDHIKQRGGKRMRPILTFLMAKIFGEVSMVTQHAALGLELLHTASLIHDDVVDESAERRGQPSLNASFNNKVSVLVGDYILSTALLHVSFTERQLIIQSLAELGQTLSSGELLQLNNFSHDGLDENIYYDIIEKKTASLFSTCAKIGAISAGATEKEVDASTRFGTIVGMIFQVRDDIFDYYDSKEIGKPTGNDMTEGKLTLPALYVLNTTKNQEMLEIANHVKHRSATEEEILRLVAFSKENGGIEYAIQKMNEWHEEGEAFIAQFVKEKAISTSLHAYLDFISERKF
jgi:octaprenyl-diphosphate synthase